MFFPKTVHAVSCRPRHKGWNGCMLNRCISSDSAGRTAKADVAVADAFALPYREGTCDGVLCIAVLHHIASEPRRLRLLKQLAHILRPGQS